MIRLDEEYRREALRTEGAALAMAFLMLSAIGKSIGIGRMLRHIMRRPGMGR